MNARALAAGYATTAWGVENLLYLALPMGFWVLASTTGDRVGLWSGAFAGLLFLIVGAIDRVGIQMTAMIQDETLLHASISGLLPVRFAVLKVTVLFMCVFAWRTTWSGRATGGLDWAWKGLGVLVLVVGVAFVFVFVPAPLAIMLWAIGLTIREWGRVRTDHPRLD